MHRVFDARLLFLHLDFGRRADVDHRNAADELREALLELLAIVVAGRLVDLRLDLLDAGFEISLLAAAVDDRAVVFVDRDALGLSEILQREVLELDAEIFADDLSAGEDRDVLEHGLAAIAEARRLARRDLERSAQLVHDQRRERLALDVFGHDEERTTR